MNPRLNRPHPDTPMGDREHKLIAQLASGGDARIALSEETGLNKYLSAPYPRDVLAYSSSTVSDISKPAFDHLLTIFAQTPDYAGWLGQIAARIRSAYAIGSGMKVVFAPSGTDLEYVALAAVHGRGKAGIHNVLLGADEIGSGCVHSARGQYFAYETASGIPVEPAQNVDGFGPISMVDIPVRCGNGKARDCATIVQKMHEEIKQAQCENKHTLVHAVHGSKTGLVLPGLAEIDDLQAHYGNDVTFVVDACQARITSEALKEYCRRGVIVLMTGSKFIGAPPFNGWAIVPAQLVDQVAPIPSGLATVFNRAEWPADWPGVSGLPDGDNRSLALRLEAAVFELQRFQAISMERVEDIITAFETALESNLIGPLGVRRVLPGGVAEELPIEMRTLATIDISMLAGLRTFDDAQVLHKRLAMSGVRLGQPVKCVALHEGWGGTLRVGLSMSQIARWSCLPADAVEAELGNDMRFIATAIMEEVNSQPSMHYA